MTDAGAVSAARATSPAADRRIVYVCAFLRAFGTGLTGILAGLYLARLGLSPAMSGLAIGVGLASAAFATLLATMRADRFGRRRFLIVLTSMLAAGGVVFACVSSAPLLLLAACIGMVNGMGRDRGAALVIEQAMLPATVSDAERTRTFAWYNILLDSGHALGALAASATALLETFAHTDPLGSTRLLLAGGAVLSVVPCVLYARLSPAVESPTPMARVTVTPETRSMLWRISSLFVIDSLGGGFLTSALVSFFFFARFAVGEAVLGPLFFGARVLNALSHLGAAWLAKRIGLVNTMVLTHIPSSLLLLTVAIAPTFPIAAIFFLLREGLVEMDVPTRQSYVMAVVRPEERTFASGVTHLVRVGAWAVGPPVAGLFMQGLSMSAPLVIAATMKISYDLLLWRAFRNVKPPEERAG